MLEGIISNIIGGIIVLLIQILIESRHNKPVMK